MNTEDIKSIIESNIAIEWLSVESEDNVHFYVTVVSDAFEGLSKIQQHKMIKSLFSSALENESIHAMSLKTYTPHKWANRLTG